MPDRLTIAVEGLRLRGRCGVTAEERALGQTLVFDLRLVRFCLSLPLHLRARGGWRVRGGDGSS